MKKRLRKKHRLGEFREDCFERTFVVEASLNEDQLDAVTDEFIEMIESKKLQYGGGGDHTWSGIVQGPCRGSATKEDCTAVLNWLQKHPRIVTAEAGPLRDAWHGWS